MEAHLLLDLSAQHDSDHRVTLMFSELQSKSFTVTVSIRIFRPSNTEVPVHDLRFCFFPACISDI